MCDASVDCVWVEDVVGLAEEAYSGPRGSRQTVTDTERDVA